MACGVPLLSCKGIHQGRALDNQNPCRCHDGWLYTTQVRKDPTLTQAMF